MCVNLRKERAENPYLSQYCLPVGYQPHWTYHGLSQDISLAPIRSASVKNSVAKRVQKSTAFTPCKGEFSTITPFLQVWPKMVHMPFLIYIYVKENRFWLLGKHLILLCLWFLEVYFLCPLWEEETILCGFFSPRLWLICDLSLQDFLISPKNKIREKS